MFKTITKAGAFLLLGSVVLGGGAIIIAGPMRTRAVLNQIQGDLLTRIDDCIDDPTALRAQLAELESEYPERISQVRGDLAELHEQVRQLEREKAISERVVAMADRDLDEFEPLVARAASLRGQAGGARAMTVALDHKVVSVERASARVNQIRHTRVAYANRAADAGHDLAYLHEQSNRLEGLLLQLENERTQFQGQIWQLSRQVDAIARNDRLIGLLAKRNRTIEECSRFDCSSLDQMTARLAEVRSRQEAELDLLSSDQFRDDYEDMARFQLQRESQGEGRDQLESEGGSDGLAEAPYLELQPQAGAGVVFEF
jgi:chromosome segregation ATPase